MPSGPAGCITSTPTARRWTSARIAPQFAARQFAKPYPITENEAYPPLAVVGLPEFPRSGPERLWPVFRRHDHRGQCRVHSHGVRLSGHAAERLRGYRRIERDLFRNGAIRGQRRRPGVELHRGGQRHVGRIVYLLPHRAAGHPRSLFRVHQRIHGGFVGRNCRSKRRRGSLYRGPSGKPLHRMLGDSVFRRGRGMSHGQRRRRLERRLYDRHLFRYSHFYGDGQQHSADIQNHAHWQCHFLHPCHIERDCWPADRIADRTRFRAIHLCLPIELHRSDTDQHGQRSSDDVHWRLRWNERHQSSLHHQ